MNVQPRPRAHTAVVPPVPDGGPRDFIAVDDSGAFSYHPSEQDLCGAFEYVEEARGIIDRRGTDFRLTLGPHRRVVLGPALGPVEFHWLRQTWHAALKVHSEAHRLQRFFPGTREQLLRDLFECLAFERGTVVSAGEGTGDGAWNVDIDGDQTRVPDLQGVDRLLSAPVRLEGARVRDPFGHVYRPVRHRRHWYLPVVVGHILYVEVPPSGATR